jgi:hypothetical protein
MGGTELQTAHRCAEPAKRLLAAAQDFGGALNDRLGFNEIVWRAHDLLLDIIVRHT